AMVLGADGVQIGSRFAATHEASSHHLYKEQIVKAKEGDTLLSLKDLAPVRLYKNEFWQKVDEAQQRGASIEELTTLLGRGRAKKGMFEGDLADGEIEFGQSSALIDEIKSAHEVVHDLIAEFNEIKKLDLNF
ncbi:MAG: NAD(P)H-dependent flavin oxidoreductase, partial [Weeksellaceae bacterium]